MSREYWKDVGRGVLTLVLIVVVFVALGCGYLFYREQVAQIEWPKRLVELRTTAANAAPVITALQRYTQAKGKPPTSLSALVPDYLPTLPAPGTAALDGKWLYQPQAEDQPSGVWVLGIAVRHDFCPRGGMSFGDYFVYYPNGTYLPAAFGGDLERIGAWGYYHE